MPFESTVRPSYFRKIAGKVIRRAGRSTAIAERRFRAFFGTSPRVCARLWYLLLTCGHYESEKPVHILWALMFLRLYETEHVNASLAQVDEKTFRKWTWKVISKLSRLNLVCSHINFIYSY